MQKYIASIIFVILVSTISLPSMQAFADFDPVTVEFLGCENMGAQTECSWKATGNGNIQSNGLSHITFGIESCLDFIDSWEPTDVDSRIASVELGFDHSTGVTGITWSTDTSFDFKSPEQMITYSVILNNPLTEFEIVSLVTKAGGSEVVVDISGPICLSSHVVTGELISLDNTALMMAGLSSMSLWMIPGVAGITGTGLFIVKYRASRV